GAASHAAWARRAMVQKFPALRDVPFEASWSGRIAMTSSHLPRIEQRGKSGISIFGYNGRGIAPGTLFGEAAAQWAMDPSRLGLPIVEPQRERLAQVRGAYFETGAVLSHLFSSRGQG
ncbi:MAG: FAD-dependent oxidoreductase, partial [Pseudomonadota bacterium]